jgi:hypothetical protein
MDHTIVDLIEDALKEIIEKGYYNLKTFNGPNMVRDRVFCYEFYHQMRTIQKTKNEYEKLKNITLHGELDKSNHKVIKGEPKPDFIFHTPGKKDNNVAVIEVKGCEYPDNPPIKNNGISSDLCKLRNFIQSYNYQYGIMLIFNSSLKIMKPVIKKISDKNESCFKNDKDLCNKIHILCARCGCDPERKTLSEILNETP